MRKIKYVIAIIIMFIFQVKVEAADFTTSLNCPSTSYTNTTINCEIRSKTETSLLNGISGQFGYNNLTYEGFTVGTGWINYASNSEGISLGNLSGIEYPFIGTLKLKVTGSPGATASITFSNIKGSNTNYDLLEQSNITKTISIIEVPTTTTTTTTKKIETTTKKIETTTKKEETTTKKGETTTAKKEETTTKKGTTQTSTNTNTSTSASEILLDDLSIENFNLSFDKHNYEYKINVTNEIEKINITAKYNSKYTVSGLGEQEVKEGENTYKITVSDGEKITTYKIEIKREKQQSNITTNNMSEVSKTLENYDDIIINLKKGTDQLIAYNEILNLIKTKDKKIIYNIIENNEIVNTITFYGKNFSEFNKDIDLTIDMSKNKTTEYNGYFIGDNNIIIDFKYTGELPKGTEFKVKIGNVYPLNTKLNLYYDNKETNKLELITKDIEIKDGYINFSLNHCSRYLMSIEEIKTNGMTLENTMKIILIMEVLIVIILKIILDIKKKKKITENY